MTRKSWLGALALVVLAQPMVHAQQQAPSTSTTADVRLWTTSDSATWFPWNGGANSTTPDQQQVPSTSNTTDGRLWVATDSTGTRWIPWTGWSAPTFTGATLTGPLNLASGTAALPGLAFSGAGWFKNANGTEFSVGTTQGPIIYAAATGTSAVTLRSDACVSWNVDGNLSGNLSPDTSLCRVAAGVVGSTPLTTTGTDVTIVNGGTLTRQRYQATITPATGGAGNCGAAFLAGALTADCTVATLPAGEKLTAVYADVTAGFTCSGTCTGTKVVQCGTAVNGTQILAASLNVAVPATYGLLDADLGTGMVRAAAIQGGLIGSWSTTTPVSCRFTSGTGFWGSGAATFVNAGSIKFTLITEQIK